MTASNAKVDEKLHVKVLAIGFSAEPSTLQAFKVGLALDPHASCCALVPPADAKVLRSAWTGAEDQALLIVHSPPDQSIPLAVQLLRCLPPAPVAVLLANFPKSNRFTALFEKKSQGQALKQLSDIRPDVQVHVYDPSWLRRPPRIL